MPERSGGLVGCRVLKANQSTAEIVQVRQAHELKVGDRVVVDVALQFLRKLRAESAANQPAGLGRSYAHTDSRSDMKRVLYFGEPWCRGKPPIDDATGYPVTVVAGCIVSKDFVAFVEEYNSVMREHVRK